MPQSSNKSHYFLLFLLLLPEIINKTNCEKADHSFPDCEKEGALSYECTVEDEAGYGATVWTGDLFNCSDSSILLSHSLYTLEENATNCGNLSAEILSVNGSMYTSKLSFFGYSPLSLNGSIINCTLSGLMLIKTIIVKMFPPPPGSLRATLFSESSLNVSWSPPSRSVEGGVGGYVFGVTGEGCGCVSMTVSADTTSVTCSGWTVAGQTCSFEVRTFSQDCGFSSVSTGIAVNLSVPSVKNLGVELIYRANGLIDEIEVTFNSADPIMIETQFGVDLNTSYVVSFVGLSTLQFTDIGCTNHCLLVVNGSQLPYNEKFFIVVTASNVISIGSPTIFPNQISTNIAKADVIQLSIDTADLLISCHLLSSYVETKDTVCSITYGYSQGNCDRHTDSSVTTTGRPGVNLTIQLSQNVTFGEKFCYTVSLKHGLMNIKVVGTFTECNPSILNEDSFVARREAKNQMCNCYGVWSQRAQVCEQLETSNMTDTNNYVILYISTVSTFIFSLVMGISVGVLSVLGWYKKSDHTTSTIADNEPTYDQPSHAQCSYGNHNQQEVYSQLDLPMNTLSGQVYDNPDEFLKVNTDPIAC